MTGRHRRPPRRTRRRVVCAAIAVAGVVAAGAAGVTSGTAQLHPAPTVAPRLVFPLEPVIPAPGPTIAPPTTTTAKPAAATTARQPTPPTTRPPRPAATPPPRPAGDCPSTGFNGVRPHVARAGHHIARRFGVIVATIGGLAPRANSTSDHPRGLALDVPAGRALGDRVAAYALEHRAALGVTYVIWRQRINLGSGWRLMEDRGSTTANHYDHVHVSFGAAAGAGLPC